MNFKKILMYARWPFEWIFYEIRYRARKWKGERGSPGSSEKTGNLRPGGGIGSAENVGETLQGLQSEGVIRMLFIFKTMFMVDGFLEMTC